MHAHMNVKYISDYYVIKVHSYTQVHLLVFLKKKIIHLINAKNMEQIKLGN